MYNNVNQKVGEDNLPNKEIMKKKLISIICVSQNHVHLKRVKRHL